jgi:hypothetical protein
MIAGKRSKKKKEKKMESKNCCCEIAKEQEAKIYKFSVRSMGAIMMCLQKSLLEQSDIVPMLQNFDVALVGGELEVMNPPTFEVGNEMLEEIEKMKKG